MPSVLDYASITTPLGYDRLLNALYMKAGPKVVELTAPAVRVIAVSGNEPPGSAQFQEAIAVLYGIGYGLKMGLKFEKLTRPKGYFDYRVGALETFWWSTAGAFRIDDKETLRWQAYLMVPAFVSRGLVEQARQQAKDKHPEVPYERASFEVVKEGRSAQLLHVGPYDQEQPTIERLHRYIAEQALVVSGRHHEIYISDPRRTAPTKLKTVIRLGVKPDSAARGRARAKATATRSGR